MSAAAGSTVATPGGGVGNYNSNSINHYRCYSAASLPRTATDALAAHRLTSHGKGVRVCFYTENELN